MRKKLNARQYRWLVYGLMVSIYFFVYFHRMSSGVVKNDLNAVFNLSATDFARLNSMYFYSYMLMQIPSGILADTLGVRKTVSLGCLCMSLGAICFGFAPNISVLFFGRLLVGLGASVVFICTLKIQATWFRDSEFAIMSGVTGFVGNLGGAMAQAPLAMLVGMLTWRMSFVAIGVVTLLLSVLAWLVIRNKPQDMGYEAISSAPPPRKGVRVGTALKNVLINPRSWTPFFINCFFSGCSMVFTTWGVSYLTDSYDISVMEGSGITFWYPIGMAVGAIVIGVASDKLRLRKPPLVVSAMGSCLCWGLLAFTQPSIETVQLIIMALGFFGAFIVVSNSVAKEVNDPAYSGMSTAFSNTGLCLGGAVFPVLAGRLMDIYGPAFQGFDLYQRIFQMCFCAVLAGCVVCMLSKETRCQNLYALKLQEAAQKDAR